MKHTVMITHEVEAASWDQAVEKVLREPFVHIVDCRVKSPGSRLIHVMPSILKEALARLLATA